MEPDFVLQGLYLLWSAAVLNMSRNLNFICMSDLLVTFPYNHILCFYTEWKKGIQGCCDSQWVFAKTKSINCFVGFALHLVKTEFECIKFDLMISVCNQKQTKIHHEAFFLKTCLVMIQRNKNKTQCIEIYCWRLCLAALLALLDLTSFPFWIAMWGKWLKLEKSFNHLALCHGKTCRHYV